MRSKKQLRIITVLMLLSLILIGTFLGVWLRSSYEAEKKNLSKSLNVRYSELIQEQFTRYLSQEISHYLLRQYIGSGHFPLTLLSSAYGANPPRQIPLFHPGDSGTQPDYAHLIIQDPEGTVRLPLDSAATTDTNTLFRSLTADIQGVGMDRSTIFFPDSPEDRGNISTQRPESHDLLKQIVGMVNGVNMIKSMDTAKLYQEFSSELMDRYKGLTVSRTRVFPDDLQIDHEHNLGELWGMEVYISHYKSYLWYCISLQFVLAIILLGICTATFYFSYRTMVQQEQLRIHKNDFISNTAHELKTPITTSLLALEAFNHFEVTDNIEQTKAYINIANNELKRLEHFIQNVLSQLSLDARRIIFKKEPIPLQQLLRNVTTRYHSSLSFYHKELDIIKPIPAITLTADPLHLESALGNVLDNAIKYGQRKIRIRSYIESGDICLHIEDDGSGISRKESRRIFERFYRVHSEHGHIVKGHGLGLSYTQYVIKAHKGKISIMRSDLGGASFIIKMPIKQ